MPSDDPSPPEIPTSRRGGRVNRLREAARNRSERWLYRDDVVRMDEVGIVIHNYYWPLGNKRIGYADISSFTRRGLKTWQGQHRVHGIDLRGRWYSRDRHRGEKELAIDLDVGGRIRPVLTVRDPDTVMRLLRQRLGSPAVDTPSGSEPPGDDDPEAWLL